jgi:V-type H+-transporting ATPase subunit a
MNAEVTQRLIELQSTLEASVRHRNSILTKIGQKYDHWLATVRKEKATYHTLNSFSIDVTRKCLVAEGWCPVSGKDAVRAALLLANLNSSAQMGTVFQPLPTRNEPPTYYKTNKVTEVFQGIVEAYGIARYREVNPAVFTIVTFPFLFAVMFGDFGHGVLMLVCAVYMVLKEKSLKTQKLNEIVQMGFDGRYVILLMSLFSIYTGLLYNECFSVPMNLFGASKFACDPNDATSNSTCVSASKTGLVPNGSPYFAGIDPVWHGTKTELPFLNSLKMKMSILMGVTQMSLGIFMSLLNFLHAKDWLSIWCEFVPQVIFLGSLFGYLSVLIVAKWVTPGCTTDLYHVMIYMFLSPGNADCQGEGVGGSPGCPENVMFPGQGGFQVLLVLAAFAAVPVMLFPKPYFLKKRHEQRLGRGGAYAVLGTRESEHGSDDEGGGGGSSVSGAGGGGAPTSTFDYGDAVVHQLIHTIEFVLGAVSNTASYLRLWALSLAHAQLSAVFWDRYVLGLSQIPTLFDAPT